MSARTPRLGLLVLLGLTLTPVASADEPASSPALVTQGVVESALALLGIRYRFGGQSPTTGFDCSGLVNHVFRETLGLSLPRTSAGLAKVGLEVARDELQAGDLVFFNTRGAPYSHVGIYVGDSRFIHAPSRDTRVRIDRMDDAAYRNTFDGARRIDPISLVIAQTSDR
ncbi:MAG: C40 family peptidase [Steroidobacteraceae bacterium]